MCFSQYFLGNFLKKFIGRRGAARRKDSRERGVLTEICLNNASDECQVCETLKGPDYLRFLSS